MPHKYHLSLDTGWEVGQVERFLKENGLITHLRTLSSSPNEGEKVVEVIVPNLRNFKRYLGKKRNRLEYDPRGIIRIPLYIGKIESKTKKEKNLRENRELANILRKIKEKKALQNKNSKIKTA